MKKTLFLITLALLNVNLTIQGQHAPNDALPTMAVYKGISLGGSFASMILDNEYAFEEINPKLGYTVGFAIRLDYIFQYFDVDLGISYSRKGANAKNMQVDYQPLGGQVSYSRDYKLHYIEIPAIINLTTHRRKENRFFAGGGIVLSIGSKGELSETWKGNNEIVKQTSDVIWDDSAEAHLQRADLGFIAQTGYRFSAQKELKISYSQSLVNIDPNAELIKNNVVSVSFVYHHKPTYTRYKVRKKAQQ